MEQKKRLFEKLGKELGEQSVLQEAKVRSKLEEAMNKFRLAQKEYRKQQKETLRARGSGPYVVEIDDEEAEMTEEAFAVQKDESRRWDAYWGDVEGQANLWDDPDGSRGLVSKVVEEAEKRTEEDNRAAYEAKAGHGQVAGGVPMAQALSGMAEGLPRPAVEGRAHLLRSRGDDGSA